MIEHEPSEDLYALGEHIFTEAIEEHLDVDDNRDLVHDTFNAKIRQSLGSGEIRVTGQDVVRLVETHLWSTINARAGRRTQKHLKDLVAGRMPLFQVNELLDLGITAGVGRRTTIRHLKLPDVARMLAEREENLAKQAAAYVEFRDEIAAVIAGWLQAHGSIPAAIDAGAVEFREEAAS